ncbi:hypothetical protein LG202_24150 [Methylobacillus methanolivorans]
MMIVLKLHSALCKQAGLEYAMLARPANMLRMEMHDEPGLPCSRQQAIKPRT